MSQYKMYYSDIVLSVIGMMASSLCPVCLSVSLCIVGFSFGVLNITSHKSQLSYS